MLVAVNNGVFPTDPKIVADVKAYITTFFGKTKNDSSSVEKNPNAMSKGSFSNRVAKLCGTRPTNHEYDLMVSFLGTTNNVSDENLLRASGEAGIKKAELPRD